MWSTAEHATTISLSLPSKPRLRLHPPRAAGSPRTLLDGGWWPRSADPVAELPGLILALQAHGHTDYHGTITHILLRVADWDSRPRRLRIDPPGPGGAEASRVVRLGWFGTMPAGLLTAIYADRQRTDLLTVPPHTSPAAARAAMELAARPDNFIRTPDILAAIPTPATWADQPEADTGPENIWESEGGRLTNTSSI